MEERGTYGREGRSIPVEVCCVRRDSWCCSEKGALHQVGSYGCLKEQPGISAEILLHSNCQEIAGHIITKKRAASLSTECL